MSTKISPYLIAFCISMLFFSCKKETTSIPTNIENPIQLQIQKTGTDYQLTWTKTNISNFQRYEIVMLDKPIPDNYIDTIISSFYSRFNIDEQNQTQLQTVLIPNADTMHYRLFVHFEDGYRVSNEVKIGFNNVTIINERIYDFLFDNSTNTFFYVKNTQSSSDSIVAFNFKNRTSTSNEFWGVELNKGDINQNIINTELFVLDYFSLSYVRVIELPNLNSTHHLLANSFLRIHKIASNDNNLIAVLLFESNNPIGNVNLQVRNVTTDEVIFEEDINSPDYATRISFFPNDPNKLLLIKEGGKTVFNFNQNGIANRIDAEPTSNSIAPVFSPDGNYFITGYANSNESILHIFNSSLELVSTHEIPFVDFTFSSDGSKVYVIGNGWSDNNLGIYDFPEMELVQNISFPLRGKKILINDNQLMIYGQPLIFDFDKNIFSVIEI